MLGIRYIQLPRVYLAEMLVGIHPWADMVKFARSGGETNSIAIRIARAASVKIILLYAVIMAGMTGISRRTLEIVKV